MGLTLVGDAVAGALVGDTVTGAFVGASDITGAEDTGALVGAVCGVLLTLG